MDFRDRFEVGGDKQMEKAEQVEEELFPPLVLVQNDDEFPEERRLSQLSDE